MHRMTWTGLLGVLTLAGATLSQDAESDRAKAASFVRLLGDAQLGDVAEKVLVGLGDGAVDALGSELADVNSPRRLDAARVLGTIGTEAAKDALRPATDDRAAGVRVAACVALVRLGDTSEGVIAGLARGLAAPDANVRSAAAQGLRAAGAEGRSAMGALVALLGDRDETVRTQAADALRGMGVAVIDPLKAGTESDSPIQRAAATRVLAGFGADAKGALPRLKELLQDDLESVRLEAIAALGALGKDAADAAPDLRPILDGGRHDLRTAAFAALDAIGPEGWNAADELMTLMRAKDARVRAFAAGQMGARRITGGVPLLMASLNDMSHLVRRAAAMSLAAIAPDDADVRTLLEAGKANRLLLSPAVAEEALAAMR